MRDKTSFEIFLATAPGTEELLLAEARERGFRAPKALPGGVRIEGRWPDVWRANLQLRGAARVLARIGSFRVLHLSELEKRAGEVPWRALLDADVPFDVAATCRKSKIYHSDAAAERIAHAITAATGAVRHDEAEVVIKARFEADVCTLAIDTTGDPLHKRGHKQAVGRAPLRETLAALFLRQCGYGGGEPVVDPMCGSGTFVIEAAEIAAGLWPGRTRNFAFEKLATFDAEKWQALKANQKAVTPGSRLLGCDRDAGAIHAASANAERAGIAGSIEFRQQAVSDLTPPEGPPGLVITNPPYGHRIGDTAKLKTLYRALGQTLKTRFGGWRVGLVTSTPELAWATGLPFLPTRAPVAHGSIRITLYTTAALP